MLKNTIELNANEVRLLKEKKVSKDGQKQVPGILLFLLEI